jgi:MarR-like DNA-binding transcriptional regulator SgrR of sgrS sRNA
MLVTYYTHITIHYTVKTTARMLLCKYTVVAAYQTRREYDIMAEAKTNKRKGKRIDVYMTDAEFELLEEMAIASAMSKTEFMRQLLLRDGDTFRRRQDASESILIAA